MYTYTHNRCVDIFASSDSSSLPWLAPFCFAHLSFSLVFHPTVGLYSLRFNISSPTLVVVARFLHRLIAQLPEFNNSWCLFSLCYALFSVCRLFPFFSLSLCSGRECVCHYLAPKEITHSKKKIAGVVALLLLLPGAWDSANSTLPFE